MPTYAKALLVTLGLIGFGVGTGLVGHYWHDITGQKEPDEHPESHPEPAEHKYTQKNDGSLQDDSTHALVQLNQAKKSKIFSEEQNKEQWVKDSVPEVKLNKDRSLSVSAHAERDGMKYSIDNRVVGSLVFLSKIMPDYAGKGTYGVYPETNDSTTEIVYHLDDSMRTALSGKGLPVGNADVFVVGTDDELKEVAYFAKEVNGTVDKGTMQNVTPEQKEKALNFLPDANDNKNPEMKKMLTVMHDNAVAKALKNSKDRIINHLGDFGLYDDSKSLDENLQDAAQTIGDWKKAFTNVSGIMDNYYNGKYNNTDDFLNDLNASAAAYNALKAKFKDRMAGNMTLEEFLAGLDQNASAFQRLLARYAPNTSEEELTSALDAARDFNDTYHRVLADYAKYGVKDNGTLEKFINDTLTQLGKMSRPFDCDAFSKAYYDTGKDTAVMLNKIEEAREFLDLTGYTLNWTDPAVRSWFRSLNITRAKDMADAFDENDVRRVDIQDAFNVGDARSAVIVPYVDVNGGLGILNYYELSELEWNNVRNAKQ